MDKFWTCFVQDSNGGYAHRHPSLEDAKAEAERLVRMSSNREKQVYVLELVAYTEVSEIPVAWYLP